LLGELALDTTKL